MANINPVIQGTCINQIKTYSLGLFLLFSEDADSAGGCSANLGSGDAWFEYWADYPDCGLLWSSGQSSWLQIQRSRVRLPPLPGFLRSSGSGTGSTQPLEYN
jgi:hypothetical protein